MASKVRPEDGDTQVSCILLVSPQFPLGGCMASMKSLFLYLQLSTEHHDIVRAPKTT